MSVPRPTAPTVNQRTVRAERVEEARRVLAQPQGTVARVELSAESP